MSVLEVLALPRTSGLSDAQRRGTDCVWCGVTLSPETARGLGPRPAPGGGTMYPQGCQGCVRREAVRVYRNHALHCTRCSKGRTECSVRRGLRQAALEGR